MSAIPETQRLLSVAEAAKYCGVEDQTVRRWVSTGRLTATRLGPRLLRIDPDELAGLVSPARTGQRPDLDAAVERVVAQAPALTPEQRDKLAVLLRGVR